jgi:starch-binding outer membrane protein, SusD/RagB family
MLGSSHPTQPVSAGVPSRSGGGRLKGGLAVTVALLVVACDMTPTNPGPVQDEFLDDPGATEAIVNGMGRKFQDALNYFNQTGSAVTRQIHTAGATGHFGVSIRKQHGIILSEEANAYWERGAQAVWVAEHGLERFERVMEPSVYASSPLVAQGWLWAGYINRMMGEHMCEAVLNGGPLEPHTVYLDRAEAAFTSARQIGAAANRQDIVMAATAGRASVRVLRNDWAGAVADAALVPSAFVYQLSFNLLTEDQYNRVAHSSKGEPLSSLAVWNVFYEDYYTESGDPRTSWGFNPDNPVGDARVGDVGHVPFQFQTKFGAPPRDDHPINLSSGWEMRLIEAENLLRTGQWQAAIDQINVRRADVGVYLYEAADEGEAWTLFWQERGIELWLEARRMADLRRWKEEGLPGTRHPLETPGHPSIRHPLDLNQSLCFPISDSERETNPNVPLAP